MLYSIRYDYILEAVEIAEQLDEINKLRMEDKIITDEWENIKNNTQEQPQTKYCIIS